MLERLDPVHEAEDVPRPATRRLDDPVVRAFLREDEHLVETEALADRSACIALQMSDAVEVPEGADLGHDAVSIDLGDPYLNGPVPFGGTHKVPDLEAAHLGAHVQSQPFRVGQGSS